MDSLIIVHRSERQPFNQHQDRVWQTCLRQVAFLNSATIHDMDFLTSDVIYQDDAALQYLLEVACGLQSPILGETEVFGQLKLFLESHKDLISQKLVNFIFQEVKAIRSEYLRDLGPKSYGSLLRKLLVNTQQDICIMGHGQLSEEILPWLLADHKITVFGRNNQKLIDFKNNFFQQISNKRSQDLESQSFDIQEYNQLMSNHYSAKSVVICAPIEDQVLLSYLKQINNLKFVYDLRSETKVISQDYVWMSLKQFFATQKETNMQSQKQLEFLKQVVVESIIKYNSRVELRPLGWDDLCA